MFHRIIYWIPISYERLLWQHVYIWSRNKKIHGEFSRVHIRNPRPECQIKQKKNHQAARVIIADRGASLCRAHCWHECVYSRVCSPLMLMPVRFFSTRPFASFEPWRHLWSKTQTIQFSTFFWENQIASNCEMICLFVRCLLSHLDDYQFNIKKNTRYWKKNSCFFMNVMFISSFGSKTSKTSFFYCWFWENKLTTNGFCYKKILLNQKSV